MAGGTVGATAITLQEAHRAGFDLVRRHTTTLLDHLRRLGPEELDQPVPGLAWNVGEVVTHLQSVAERYMINLERAASPGEVRRLNAADVERIGVDVDRSIRSIEDQITRLGEIVEHVPADQTFPFHAGRQVTLAGGWGNWLGELLAHGDDLARATGRPFEIPGNDLEILWRHTTSVMGGWLRWDARDLEETWDLHFPFGTVRWVIDHGVVHVDDGEPGHGDRHEITVADPAAFTLAFPYRRRLITDPDTALLATRFQDV
jgi:uncharacterized protein (TIGR03083 family)